MFILTFSWVQANNNGEKINQEVNLAIEKFKKDVPGGNTFLKKVKGYLVFPKVYKGGLIIGGEYGKGALRVQNKTKYFYSITSASAGYQLGAQSYSMLIAFASDAALNNFINSNGWEAGVDGSIVISDWGKAKDITSISYEKPIIAFVFGEEGLMAGVSIEGTKFEKIMP
jgi:lipid-binding SYLF domain-containing protein